MVRQSDITSHRNIQLLFLWSASICFLTCREVLKEDEFGSLKATVEEILFQSKRKRYASTIICHILVQQISVLPQGFEETKKCIFVFEPT